MHKKEMPLSAEVAAMLIKSPFARTEIHVERCCAPSFAGELYALAVKQGAWHANIALSRVEDMHSRRVVAINLVDMLVRNGKFNIAISVVENTDAKITQHTLEELLKQTILDDKVSTSLMLLKKIGREPTEAEAFELYCFCVRSGEEDMVAHCADLINFLKYETQKKEVKILYEIYSSWGTLQGDKLVKKIKTLYEFYYSFETRKPGVK